MIGRRCGYVVRVLDHADPGDQQEILKTEFQQ